MSDKLYTAIEGLNLGNAFINERGLHFRLDTKELRGAVQLHEIAKNIRRPVDTWGRISTDHAYLWITIPMMRERRSEIWIENKPAKKRKRP